MKQLTAVVLCLALLSGCQAPNVSNYWNNRSIDYSDIQFAENQFADFAELASASNGQDALKAMDVLFDKLKKDTVAYYIYSNWMDGAFYSLLSPCRNAALYSKAVERIVADGILNMDECDPFLQRREWIQYNLKGTEAIVPGLSKTDTRTLVLVLDLGCPSCREALEAFAADPKWNEVQRMAVCMGYGPKPSVSGWNYLFPENASAVFDIHMTPICFVVAADGTVESGYQPVL